MRGSRTFECGIHDLNYTATRAGCPACEAEREVKQIRNSLKDAHNQLALLTEQNRLLKVDNDIVTAIREAAPTLGDEDMAFLKATLYEWRDQKSVALKTTHGPRTGRRKQLPTANGFIAMPRKGVPYGHVCTSIGGLAIAEYFDEATNANGSANAMIILARGMAAYLPGGNA